MPKVRMLATAADADGVLHAGSVVNLSKSEAQELVDGGYATQDVRAVEPSEDEAQEPAEKAVGRRGRTRTISGEENA